MTRRRLSAEQRAALDALNPQRQTFVLALVGEAGGNATEAARIAKYAHPKVQGPRLTSLDIVRRAIDAFREPERDRRIASIDDLRELWTTVAFAHPGDDDPKAPAEPADMKERLKAAELLGKSLGAFVDRKEITGAGGGPLAVAHRIIMTPQIADELASDAPRQTERAALALPEETDDE